MRGIGFHLLNLTALSLLILAAGAPLSFGLVAVAAAPAHYAAALSDHPAWSWEGVPILLGRTFLWGVAIAAGAVALGTPAGIAIGLGRPSLSRAALVSALIAALCVPSYLLYWAWGLLIVPRSPLGELAQRSRWWADALSTARLFWGMALWTSPIASLALAGALRTMPPAAFDLPRIDGAGPIRRSLLLARQAWPGLALGFGLAFLSTLTSYVPFDLAFVETYGNVLRRLATELGQGSGPTTLASLPLVVVSLLIAGALTWGWQRPLPGDPAAHHMSRPCSTATGWIVVFTALAAPAWLMASRLPGLDAFLELGPIEGRSILRSLITASVSGALIGFLALGMASMWVGGRASRAMAWLSTAGWLWIGLTPAAAIGAMLVLAYNRPGVAHAIYASPAIVVLGHLARFGLVAVLVGRWLSAAEAEATRDLRRIDGADTLGGWMASAWPRPWTAALSTAVIGAALSLSEVSTTVIVTPPDFQSLGERLLNKLHYAREDSAIATCLLLLAIVIPLGLIGSLGLRPLARGRSMHAWALAACLGASAWLGACGPVDDGSADAEAADKVLFVFASTGRGEGQLLYPRAADADPVRNRLYVVDKSGHISIFSTIDGSYLGRWELPAWDRGFPTGITVHPDGRVFVPHTHEQKVFVFDPDGRVVQEFGEYGMEPGQFIYPTDVAFGPDGIVYVAEYGGNDRVQAFTSDGQILFSFGAFGGGEGQFSRPQSIVFDPNRQELWIADACNHRIVITDPQGRWLDVLGGPGSEPGQLNYPYGLVLQADGSALVCEYGAHRVQRIARDGASLGTIGGLGDGPGRFRHPWAIAATPDRLFVIDSANDRVQAIVRP